MRSHCEHARFVWNIALQQWSCWRPGRRAAPPNGERMRQLTDARRAFPWLADGSVTVQQQALRDFDQAVRNFYAGTHRRPRWRKAGLDEGFRQIHVESHHVRRLNRRWAQVWVPKCGWVRFRWTRPVPGNVRSYRVTLDRVGRWHIAFAKKPEPIPGPGTGEVVGIDRGVTNTVALSSGELLSCPAPRLGRERRLKRRLAARCKGSNRREEARRQLARLKAREADRRNDWVEQTTTRVVRQFDVIRIEDLPVKRMSRSARGTWQHPGRNVRAKASLNRSILAQAWGRFARRLEDKAPGRVERVDPAYTSQTCSACGYREQSNRESQAKFCCRACGYVDHADVNAARNVRRGTHGGSAGSHPDGQAPPTPAALAANREPQLVLRG
jgi:putative transposase